MRIGERRDSNACAVDSACEPSSQFRIEAFFTTGYTNVVCRRTEAAAAAAGGGRPRRIFLPVNLPPLPVVTLV